MRKVHYQIMMTENSGMFRWDNYDEERAAQCAKSLSMLSVRNTRRERECASVCVQMWVVSRLFESPGRVHESMWIIRQQRVPMRLKLKTTGSRLKENGVGNGGGARSKAKGA
jgi:hypothetical protein